MSFLDNPDDIPGELLFAIDRDAYNFLEAHDAPYIQGVTEAVRGRKKQTPRQVYQAILRETRREELSLRCGQAARFVYRNGDKGETAGYYNTSD